MGDERWFSTMLDLGRILKKHDARYSSSKWLREFAEKFGRLQDQLFGIPFHKLMSGQLLTEEEFYLARLGAAPATYVTRLAEILWIQGYDNFAVYCLLHYEDEERRGIIHPDSLDDRLAELCSSGRTPLRLTVIPHEQVLRRCLRDEQAAFLLDRFPRDWARFVA